MELKQQPQENVKYIIRIANTDLDGMKPILTALRKVRGVSYAFSYLVCTLAKVDMHAKAGALREEEVQRISAVLKDPLVAGAPAWMLNRKKDPELGTTRHVVGTDLALAVENDIKRMKMIKSYRGWRHSIGQPTRGQRTRSNFRRNKGKVVGVAKKKIVPGAAPAKDEGKKKGKD